MRNATITDIVRRLTGTGYQSTAAPALAGGMGDAQLNIDMALDDAIAAGFVKVVRIRDTTYAKQARFVALADGITYCATCIDGCDHGGKAGGEPGSCGHLGCWGPAATNDCVGAQFARAADTF